MQKASFKVSRYEHTLIRDVVDRAVKLSIDMEIKASKFDIAMDVTAAHVNACKPDLERLIAADDFNFAHDVFGIMRHIDRDTGNLRDCFRPRCAFQQ